MSKEDVVCSFRDMGCCFTDTASVYTSARRCSCCFNYACLQCCFLARGISVSEQGEPLKEDGTVDRFLSSVTILCQSCTRVKDKDAIKKYYKLVKELKKQMTKTKLAAAKLAKLAAAALAESEEVTLSLLSFFLSLFLSLCMLNSNSHWLPRRKRYWAVLVASVSLI